MNARHAMTLQDLLAIEDDAALLDFRCPRTGLLLWPLIRVAVLRSVMAELLYGDAGAQMVASRRVPAQRAAATLARSVLHNARAGRFGASDVCLMPTGIGLMQWRGRWFNRLSDHFALALPQRSLVIEDQFDWQWPFPRHFERVLFHAPLQVRATLAGRGAAGARHSQLAERLIGFVAERAEREIGWKLPADRRAALVTTLARKAAALPSSYDGYRRLLAGTGARLLLKEDACYGPASVIIAAARSLGMATAEYQHGAISAGHDGYNFAPALRQSEEYRRTLPDTFLGYGQWWLDQVNAPVEKIAVGNPHRAAQLAELAAGGGGERRDVLLLGDGVETAVYLALARGIAAEAQRAGLRVVFRPHPLERATLANHWQETPNLFLDQNTDIYTSLAAAHAVVSELSTGLFEAIGLAQKVFLWNTPKARFAYPVHPFATFDDAQQLGAMLAGGEGALSPGQVDAIWAPGWQQAYTRYVDTALARAAQEKAA